MATKKIKEPKEIKITKQQESQMSLYKEKWLKNGLSCDPLDFENAKPALADAYRAAGAEPPRFVFHMQSPIGGAVGSACMKVVAARDLFIEGVDRVRAELPKKLGDDRFVQKARQEYPGDSDPKVAVARAIWMDFWMKEMLQPTESGGIDLTPEAMNGHIQDQVFGSHDCAWVAFYDFFDKVLKVPDVIPLRGLIRLAELCGWWTPYADFAILQDRQEVLKLNEQRQLHCTDGPALKYRDGISLYMINDQCFARHVIEEPNKITVDEIKTEQNAECRRIKRERFDLAHGPGAYLRAIDAKIIHSDVEPFAKGAAPRCLVEDDQGERWLIGTDGSTKRVYYMPVGQDVKTCSEAHKLISGFDESKILNKS